MKFHFGLFERTDDAGSLTPLRTTISKLIKAEMAFFFRVVGQILSEGMWGTVSTICGAQYQLSHPFEEQYLHKYSQFDKYLNGQLIL